MRSLCFALAVAFAPSAWAVPVVKHVFLNGVAIDGVVSQRFEGATVVIDDKGNIFITAKGVEVVAADKVPAPKVAEPPVTRQYYLVADGNKPGAGYDVDVFINGKFAKRVSAQDPHGAWEVSKHMHKGANKFLLVATKVVNQTPMPPPDPTQKPPFVSLLVGEGKQEAGVLTVERTLLEYKRSGAETQNFADEFVVEGQ